MYRIELPPCLCSKSGLAKVPWAPKNAWHDFKSTKESVEYSTCLGAMGSKEQRKLGTISIVRRNHTNMGAVVLLRTHFQSKPVLLLLTLFTTPLSRTSIHYSTNLPPNMRIQSAIVLMIVILGDVAAQEQTRVLKENKAGKQEEKQGKASSSPTISSSPTSLGGGKSTKVTKVTAFNDDAKSGKGSVSPTGSSSPTTSPHPTGTKVAKSGPKADEPKAGGKTSKTAIMKRQ